MIDPSPFCGGCCPCALFLLLCFSLILKTLEWKGPVVNMEKRRHHYVWRKYLRAWAKNESVWCRNEGKIFKSNLMNIGQIKDFYKLKELSTRDIEIIHKIAIEPTPPGLQKINKRWVSLFNSVFQLKRDLEQRGVENTEINELLDEYIQNAEEDLHGKIESDAIEYIESILNEDINFFKTDEGYMNFMHFLCIQYMRTNKIKSNVLDRVAQTKSIDVEVIERIWNILSHIYATNMGKSFYDERHSYHLFLLKNRSQKELITGDQPVINTYATGHANSGSPKEVEFYYPVSPQLAALITKSVYNILSDKIILKEDEVDKYNLMIIKQSHSQIYASSKEILNNLFC